MANRLFVIFSACLLLIACTAPPPSNTALEILYVGTYSVRNSEGLYSFQFDRQAKDFQLIETVSGPDSPSFLDISADGKYLYTANRQGIEGDDTFGAVLAYQIDPASGKLQLINQSSSYGASPCHISVGHKGKWLFLSHYAGGSITVLPVLENGSIGSLFDTVQHLGHSKNEERQAAPHLHSTVSIPGTDLFLAADLGTDKLYFYQIGKQGIQQASISPIEVEPGSGPRHFTFSADHRYIYLAEELSSTVSVYNLDISRETITSVQRLSTLPATFQDKNTVADIHLSPDGRFLYVSNRGHDSLAIYEVDPDDGSLQLIGHQSTLGEIPRNFMIDPAGEFMLVANQDSDEIVFFDRDSLSGLLQATDIRIKLPSPVCLKWLAL